MVPCASYTSLSRLLQKNGKGTAKVAATDPSDAVLELCPQCRKKYSRTEDVVLLNPSQDEEDVMPEAMQRKRLFELVKKPKSSKKRKNDLPTDNAEHPVKKRGRARRYPRRVRRS